MWNQRLSDRSVRSDCVANFAPVQLVTNFDETNVTFLCKELCAVSSEHYSNCCRATMLLAMALWQ